jgi:regulator of protease activity HflC (stomatin/prohibitin superfamily)
MNEYREPNYAVWGTIWTFTALIGLAFLTTLGMYGCPLYGVYEQRKAGEAALAHAQSSKEVAVAEARAKMESSTLLAQAEVSRAEGVAKANKIIGDSLRNNESYLRYLWIIEVAQNNNGRTVVYVPTETNLPILEATRHAQ